MAVDLGGLTIALEAYRRSLDGKPAPVMDAAGEPVLDENGFVSWQYEDMEITVTRGFLGVNIGRGMLPPRYAR